jgi:hypothetical protein
VFADTQAEPKEVYDHLDWLEKQVKRTPIAKVTAGDLRADAMVYQQSHTHSGNGAYASLPLYVLNRNGEPGMQNRQCTKYYKIIPVHQYIRREMLGLEAGDRIPPGVIIEHVFGISYNERERMRCPQRKCERNEYPFVDRRMNRWNVIDLAKKWYPDHHFPRSACIECPYHKNEEWRSMPPDEFEIACQIDERLREADIANGGGGTFLHRSRKPLRVADLRDDDDRNGQLSIYGMVNECEGMCGV